jgi:hypothetical protein
VIVESVTFGDNASPTISSAAGALTGGFFLSQSSSLIRVHLRSSAVKTLQLRI